MDLAYLVRYRRLHVVEKPSVVLSILSGVFECLVILTVLGHEALKRYEL